MTVITFHRILPAPERLKYPFPNLAVTPEELDDIISYLLQYFDCGTLERQTERYTTDESADRPLLALTFDDAQYDNFRYARPVLARHGIHASFFAPVVAIERGEPLWHDALGFPLRALLANQEDGKEELTQILSNARISISNDSDLIHSVVQEAKRLTLDKRYRLIDAVVKASQQNGVPDFARMMTFDELGVLAGDGHEIGSHSMTHCLMTECNDEMLRFELFESRRRLESILGRPVTSFCYPNGNCDTRTAVAAKEAGYLRAVTTRWGHNDRHADVFQLRRFDMESAYLTNSSGTISPALLAYRVSGLQRRS